MKKYIMAATVLLASAFGTLAAEYSHSVVVHLTNGSDVEYLFEDMPVAFIEGSDVRIQTQVNGIQVTYPMADIVNMTMKKEVVGVNGVDAADTSVRFGISRETLDASGLPAGQRVLVFDAAGAVMADGTCGADGSVSIEIGGFGPGVYVVNAGANSFKFIR